MNIYKRSKDKVFPEDGLLQSLYYLYQEILKANMNDLAFIMEATICDCEESVRSNFTVSQFGEEIFKQFHLLRRFRHLNQEQKEAFIREIESDIAEH